jgi:hypothetical protein
MIRLFWKEQYHNVFVMLWYGEILEYNGVSWNWIWGGEPALYKQFRNAVGVYALYFEFWLRSIVHYWAIVLLSSNPQLKVRRRWCLRHLFVMQQSTFFWDFILYVENQRLRTDLWIIMVEIEEWGESYSLPGGNNLKECMYALDVRWPFMFFLHLGKLLGRTRYNESPKSHC